MHVSNMGHNLMYVFCVNYAIIPFMKACTHSCTHAHIHAVTHVYAHKHTRMHYSEVIDHVD